MAYRGAWMVGALLALGGLIGGCGSKTVTVTCTPACPSGMHCSDSGCVLDQPLPGADAGGPDAPAPCGGGCPAEAPYCENEVCMVCLTDDNCPVGFACQQLGQRRACLPGCTMDAHCAAAAGTAMRCCGGRCVDTSSDAANCGGCALACTQPHGLGSCVASACMPSTCSAGWADCNGDAHDGCEANLSTDPANCTACGSACRIDHASAGCAGSCYLLACEFGWDDCNSDISDGCETSVVSDPRNCGGCGLTCPPVAHAQSACVGALCALTGCDVGHSDCDGSELNGCEVTIYTDVKNCGGCGNACAKGQVCKNGSCTCPQCAFANAKSGCVNNECALLSCLPGYGNCDKVDKNGCEVSTDSDANNCGACGNVCPVNLPGCDHGVCTDQFYGLVSYWKFDGDFTDSVGGNDLSIPPGQSAPGFAGGQIDQATSSPMGDPQNLWIPNLPDGIDNNSDFTLAFWANSNGSSWYDGYVAWDSGGLGVYRHQQDKWRYLVFLSDVNGGNINLNSGVDLPAPPTPGWHLVVVYRSGDTVGIKINDGVPAEQQVGQLAKGQALYVSRGASGYSWCGQLDEMGYWNRKLTDDEMTKLYNGGAGRTFP